MRIRLALALAALVAGACGPPPPPTVPALSLVGVEWEALLIRGREPGIAAPPTIVFHSPDRVEGNAGCNSYSGTFTLRVGSLSITNLFSTDMACHGPERDVESAFFLALGAAHTATVVGERLILTGPEGTIEFRAVRTVLEGANTRSISRLRAAFRAVELRGQRGDRMVARAGPPAREESPSSAAQGGG